ncbi:MAG: patatin-like phospholipase family protein [Acidobacteriota bacterium]
MSRKALRILAGPTARRRLAERGWDVEIFSLLLGAAGGPKWLVLSQLDRVLFGDFLARRKTPLNAYGTSIGSWRHACLAQADPAAAIGRFEKAYIEQSYSDRPNRREVSSVGRGVLREALGDGVEEIPRHPKLITHIGTARGRGPLAFESLPLQALGLGLAILGNSVSRRGLEPWYQRVIFSSGPWPGAGLALGDFATESAPHQAANVADVLMASASIPMVLEGVSSPAGSPPGYYWDGGVIDYHHDLTAYRGDGLVLFPHFFSHITPGWFDKRKPRRRPAAAALDKVVLLTATEEFVADLPGGSIPDRRDFKTYGTEERLANWWRSVELCQALADEFLDVVSGSDPLGRVEAFG